MGAQIDKMTLEEVANLFGCKRLALYTPHQPVGSLIFWEGTRDTKTLEQAVNGAGTWALASDGEHPQRLLAIAIDGGYVASGELSYEWLQAMYNGRLTSEMAAAYNGIGKTF